MRSRSLDDELRRFRNQELGVVEATPLRVGGRRGKQGTAAAAATALTPSSSSSSLSPSNLRRSNSGQGNMMINGNHVSSNGNNNNGGTCSFYVFWGFFLFSLTWNLYFLHQHFILNITNSTQKQPLTDLQQYTSNGMARNMFDSNAASAPPPPLPSPALVDGANPISNDENNMKQNNRAKLLQDLVNLDSAEMVLKTAWQGLLKQRMKKTPYRILTNVLPRRKQHLTDDLDEEEDFSLSTHGTVGRLDRLLEEYRRWGGGPMSAALYISTEDEIDMLVAFIQDKGALVPNLAIHVLMEDLSFQSKQYPNNILRNLAMSQLETNYFVALDVDFVTNVNAYPQLRQLQRQYPQLTELLRNQTLFVLPAFESENRNVTKRNATGHVEWHEELMTMEAPLDKYDLIQQYEHGIVQPFHLRHFPPGHGPTRFPLWFENRTGPFYSTIYHKRFEPYVLAYRKGLPTYWTGFRGYFFNKYSFFLECHSMGYNFAVLRDFFVFHVGKSGGSSRIPKWKQHEWAKFLEYNYRIWGNRSVQEFGGYHSIY